MRPFAFATVTVYCADCHAEAVGHGSDVDNAAWHLRRQGWHSRGHAKWVCPRHSGRRRRGGR